MTFLSGGALWDFLNLKHVSRHNICETQLNFFNISQSDVDGEKYLKKNEKRTVMANTLSKDCYIFIRIN